MIRGARIAVVVPAFQEAAHIAGVVSAMPAFVDHIVLVDDASSDDTSERARRAITHARLTVVRHPHNTGVGRAIVDGYRQALRLGADVVGVMAGDGQMDPDDFYAVLLPLLDGVADYVKGNRLAHPEVWRVMPKARLLGSLVLSQLTTMAVGLPIHDSQCGYTAVSRSALGSVDLDALWASYGYPNDLIGAMVAAGQHLAEVTVRPIYGTEKSGMRLRHVVTILGLLARVRLRRIAAGLRPRQQPKLKVGRRTL